MFFLKKKCFKTWENRESELKKLEEIVKERKINLKKVKNWEYSHKTAMETVLEPEKWYSSCFKKLKMCLEKYLHFSILWNFSGSV